MRRKDGRSVIGGGSSPAMIIVGIIGGNERRCGAKT
jgi:hypothetical protein